MVTRWTTSKPRTSEKPPGKRWVVGGGEQNAMYEFIVDDNKGVVTLGGHTVERLTEFQIKANGPTEPTEVILHVMVDRVKVDLLAH